MIPISKYRDKKVAVFGLGRSGLSAVRALIGGGATVLVWDDEPNRRQAAAHLGAFATEPSIELWAGISTLVLSPGVPFSYPKPHPVVTLANSLGAEILGDVELFARNQPKSKVFAITGTNGKSTTTSLLHHIFVEAGVCAQAGANLGHPVLDFEILGETAVYILELSSYQIDLTSSLRPDAAALINLSPDHLDRHGGMDGYVEAKRRLLEMAGSDVPLVIGGDDKYSSQICRDMTAIGRKVIEIAIGRNIDAGFFVKNGLLQRAGYRGVITDLSNIDTLKGAHNWQNAAVAFALAETFGLSEANILHGLRSYPGLPHRMELVAQVDNVLFVNDSKATNLKAAAYALASYDNIFWIAGGIAKQENLDALLPHGDKVRHAYLIGEAASLFSEYLTGRVKHEISSCLGTAIRAAYQAASKLGGVVLLSPACASFDQFTSFEARGDHFRTVVLEISGDDRSGPSCCVAGGTL